GQRVPGAFGPVPLAVHPDGLHQPVVGEPLDGVVQRPGPDLDLPVLGPLDQQLVHLVRVHVPLGEQGQQAYRERSQTARAHRHSSRCSRLNIPPGIYVGATSQTNAEAVILATSERRSGSAPGWDGRREPPPPRTPPAPPTPDPRQHPHPRSDHSRPTSAPHASPPVTCTPRGCLVAAAGTPVPPAGPTPALEDHGGRGHQDRRPRGRGHENGATREPG